MLSKLNTLFHTLSHLKPIQAIYQVKNRLSKVGPLSSFQIPIPQTHKLDFFETPAINQFLKVESGKLHFEFLNLTRTYPKSSIDWNDQTHGKLWNYNLQYLDFLKQENLSLEIKIQLVKDIYHWLWTGKLPIEPYPASLRIMNMVRFLNANSTERIYSEELEKYLLAEINYLSQNLEYHLLANHLLENAFAFWMGALYFQKQEWIDKAGRLLKEQLDEQILPDGGHYELAPMYHQIILFRVLEAYFLTPQTSPLKSFLKEKAESMLGWLDQMTFRNGSLPHFNDTTEGIAYSPAQLLDMGKSIGLSPKEAKLKESGFRILQSGDLKLMADIEGIKPSYQPGHAHADTFSFVLHDGNTPVVVDPGISTYNISPRRDWERSTLAHNTITIDRRNSSQVWAGFRVGKRAKVKLVSDTEYLVSAQHDGFGPQIHQRTFKLSDAGFQILDEIIGLQSNSQVEARFYLHPELNPRLVNSGKILLRAGLWLVADRAADIQIGAYEFALGYNMLVPSKLVKIKFSGNTLSTSITCQA